jgi:hypothetical protein
MRVYKTPGHRRDSAIPYKIAIKLTHPRRYLDRSFKKAIKILRLHKNTAFSLIHRTPVT